MSKRTWDGPTIVQIKRCCFGQLLTPTPMPMPTPMPTSNKRKHEFVNVSPKANRSPKRRLSTPVIEKRGTKRSACFDSELEHLEKRMRASIPTATEAIAFLIPHMLKLRSLYNASQQKVEDLKLSNRQLKADNLELNKNLCKLGSVYYSENARLKRELDLVKYRLQIFGQKPPKMCGF